MTAPAPYPGLLAAIWLTLAAWMASALVLALASQLADPTLAQGIALTLGFGVVGTLAARRVAAPQAERLGLRGFAPRFALPLLLMLPLMLLAKEVQNVVAALQPPPDAAEIAQRTLEMLPTDATLSAIQTLLLVVGLAPVLEEWFFRGVLQQGLVARWGAWRGVLAAALLYALLHGGVSFSAQAWLVASTGALLYGVAFGLLRVASGSLLAPILLHSGINAIGALSLAFQGSVAIPGFNAAGAHIPAAALVPSALAVAAGAALALWAGRRAAAPPRAPGLDPRG